jgi:hypothetical protein
VCAQNEEERIRLIVSSACGISRSQASMVKAESTVQRIAMKWFFQVRMLRSALLVGRYILDLDGRAMISAVLFQQFGGFVILRSDAMSSEEISTAAVRFDVFRGVARAKSFGMNVVAADHYQNVVGAALSLNRETPCEISVPKVIREEELGIHDFNVRYTWV